MLMVLNGRYYLLLAFLFAFVIPEILILIEDLGVDIIIKGANVIYANVENMHIQLVLGYASYFVLGYYINKISLTTKQRIIIYVLGILGFGFTVIMDLMVALKTQMPCKNYYGNFMVNVLFEALAVFTWFKYGNYRFSRLNVIMQKLSKYSFGAYLFHALVIEQLNIYFGLNTLSFNPIVGVLLIIILVFVVSFTISTLLNKIPIVKKYMV